MMITNDLVVFGGRASKDLTQEICLLLSQAYSSFIWRPGEITITNFNDGETFVQLKENVRGKDVYFVQSTCTPVNDNLMELLIMIDTAKRSSAERITAIIPYFGYGRQDRKDRPRVPITAKLVANMIVQAGATRVVSIDMHTGQLQGFFDIPVDHLIAAPVLIKAVRELPLKRGVVVISPDAGYAERASIFADHLNVPLSIIDKRRDRQTNNESKSLRLIGDVLGKDVVIIDDMIDTGGTMIKGIELLLDEGAEDVYIITTHGVFSKRVFLPNVQKIEAVRKIILTNTIAHDILPDMFQCVSIAPLLADAIRFIHEGKSVTSLLNIL
jgi:ribose-phosphate pyrophosphokinase